MHRNLRFILIFNQILTLYETCLNHCKKKLKGVYKGNIKICLCFNFDFLRPKLVCFRRFSTDLVKKAKKRIRSRHFEIL